jgi:hypothetical protein
MSYSTSVILVFVLLLAQHLLGLPPQEQRVISMSRMCSFVSGRSSSMGIALAESIMLDESLALAPGRETEQPVTIARVFDGWFLLWK